MKTRVIAVHRCAGEHSRLQDLGKFRAESRLLAWFLLALLALLAHLGNLFGFGFLGTRRLSGIGPQKAIFEWSAIKTADDRLHFVCRRGLDEGESLRFLGLVIADDFYRVGYQVLRRQPLLDIVSGDPGREVAKKDSKAHSVIRVTPLVGFVALQGEGSDLCQLDGNRRVGCLQMRFGAVFRIVRKRAAR